MDRGRRRERDRMRERRWRREKQIEGRRTKIDKEMREKEVARG